MDVNSFKFDVYEGNFHTGGSDKNISKEGKKRKNYVVSQCRYLSSYGPRSHSRSAGPTAGPSQVACVKVGRSARVEGRSGGWGWWFAICISE